MSGLSVYEPKTPVSFGNLGREDDPEHVHGSHDDVRDRSPNGRKVEMRDERGEGRENSKRKHLRIHPKEQVNRG